MPEEKCFCHFNGYKVKDADAQKKIEELKAKVKLHVLHSDSTQDISVLQVGNINILIDSGKANDPNDNYGDTNSASEHISILQNLGINRIDYIYLTHYHEDHVTGLYAIGDAIDMKNAVIFRPAEPTAAELPLLRDDISNNIKLVKLAIDENELIDVIPTEDNHIFEIGDVTLDFRNYDTSFYFDPENYPSDFYEEEGLDYNNLCLCCIVSYGSSKIGFFGDISYIAQQRLANTIGNLDLMSVEHHGLNAFLYNPFYDSIAPKMCFTQNGLENAGRARNYLARINKTQTYLQENNIPNYTTGINGTMTFYIGRTEISTEANAIQYASKKIKGTTSLIGAINQIGTDTDISLGTLLKGMEHGSLLSTEVYKSTHIKLWNALIKDFVPGELTKAQLIIYKGGSSGHNQSVDDCGWLFIMPETTNPLSGVVYGNWRPADQDYSSISVMLRPMTNLENFKFYREADSDVFKSISQSTHNMVTEGNNISMRATGMINYSVHLKNNSNADKTYTFELNGSNSVIVPANGNATYSNVVYLEKNSVITFPKVDGLYVRFTGFITYAYNNSFVIEESEFDDTIPYFNKYPLF